MKSRGRKKLHLGSSSQGAIIDGIIYMCDIPDEKEPHIYKAIMNMVKESKLDENVLRVKEKKIYGESDSLCLLSRVKIYYMTGTRCLRCSRWSNVFNLHTSGQKKSY